MSFPHPAGWHVVIGDNGSGKSGLLQAIAACLMGPARVPALRYNLNRLLRIGETAGQVRLELSLHTTINEKNRLAGDTQVLQLGFERDIENGMPVLTAEDLPPKSPVWNGTREWFSASFGPFRRMEGGQMQNNNLYDEDHRAAAHFSVFEPDVAFVKVDEWLKYLKLREFENIAIGLPPHPGLLTQILRFLNQDDLLPNGFKVSRIGSDGIFVTTATGQEIPISWLSEGYKSVLSLMFELIRQMAGIFFIAPNHPHFFKKQGDRLVVPFPGVVMIDEVDAHLHPSWQTRIGNWFTTFFPHVQFIVTTHSPLVCRSVGEKGTIWRLKAPDSIEVSGQITGADRMRLIYGNILDAFDTDTFGEDISINSESAEKLERLADLNLKSIQGYRLSDEEQLERRFLQQVFPTQHGIFPE